VNSKVISAAGWEVGVGVSVGTGTRVGMRVGVKVAVGVNMAVPASSGTRVLSGLECMINGSVSSYSVAVGEKEMAVGLGVAILAVEVLDAEGLRVGTPVLLLSTQPLTTNPNSNTITTTDLAFKICSNACLSFVSAFQQR
jgi:hypothetical protein